MMVSQIDVEEAVDEFVKAIVNGEGSELLVMREEQEEDNEEMTEISFKRDNNKLL